MDAPSSVRVATARERTPRAGDWTPAMSLRSGEARPEQTAGTTTVRRGWWCGGGGALRLQRRGGGSKYKQSNSGSLPAGPSSYRRSRGTTTHRRKRDAYLGYVCVWPDAARSMRRAAGLGSRRIFRPRGQKRTLRVRFRRAAGYTLSVDEG